MLAAVNNSDFLFCYLKVASRTLDHPLKEKLDIFLADVKDVLFLDSETLKKEINNKLPAIFDLRLETLRWFVKENIDFYGLITKEVVDYFEGMRRAKRLSALSEKLAIALSLNNIILESILKESQGRNLTASQIPSISFEEWTALVYLSNPNSGKARSLIDWCKCSLYIEYIALAAFTIFDESLLVDQEKINQLAYILDETTQAYASLASELNVINIPEQTSDSSKFSSKGAAIFKKMLDDKKAIRQHLENGGQLSDLKDKFSFANPVSITGN